MHIAILGRQPAISIAELERVYGDVSWFSDVSALVGAEYIDITRLGGSQKTGLVILQVPGHDWHAASMKIVQHYSKVWAKQAKKITLGISAYGFKESPRDIQKTGLILKGKLKSTGTSLRLIPNQAAALSTATSHHNKLGLSNTKVELIVVKGQSGIVVAESTGAQHITSLAARDQGRPKRDAFVGMLPPKLAQIMVNLAGPLGVAGNDKGSPRVLDPFCGTGVILQEAGLMNYAVYGTDLSEKMIDFTRQNLKWIADKDNLNLDVTLHVGDAMTTTWEIPVDAVVAEGYLGQPFSAPPSSSKLMEVRGNTNHILSEFLKNLAEQIKPGTPVVLAVPAWKHTDGHFTHLPLVVKVEELGYRYVEMRTVRPHQLLYFRPDQVVAREILVLVKK
ncbi:MAG: methyltransferase domain-containing protein [Candidatus Microsaccharimonas sossegonensis]|uniref:Methyltransferase domain-containing protein n=1 Tax=Candidatus Microsaccharimonas sossegonensis TaxID=2506948 RepID=A0A4Q0AHL0_9BACT|nr:MAG: methyltransferase domain-containing protein [Candidatus Microsaccharimonas sossegonensis]